MCEGYLFSKRIFNARFLGYLNDWGSQALIEGQIKGLDAYRAEVEKQTRSEAEKQKIYKEIEQTQARLINQQKLLADAQKGYALGLIETENRLQKIGDALVNNLDRTQRLAKLEDNSLKGQRVSGAIDDVSLQRLQGQSNVNFAQQNAAASAQVVTLFRQRLEQQFPSNTDIPNSIRNLSPFQGMNGEKYSSGLEAVFNTSSENIKAVLDDPSYSLLPEQRSFLEQSLKLKEYVAKSADLQGQLKDAQLAQIQFEYQRLIKVQETNRAIAANRASIGLNDRILAGQVGSRVSPLYQQGLAIDAAQANLKMLQSRRGNPSEDPVDLERQISEGQKSISDLRVQYQQSIRDFRRSLEDTVISAIRETRGLRESWTDLIYGLTKSLKDSQLELRATQRQIKAAKLQLGIEEISFNDENIAKKFLSIVTTMVSSLDQSKTEAEKLDNQRSEINQQYVQTLRQIRGEQEKQLDAERQRSRTLIDLNGQYLQLLGTVNEQVQGMLKGLPMMQGQQPQSQGQGLLPLPLAIATFLTKDKGWASEFQIHNLRSDTRIPLSPCHKWPLSFGGKLMTTMERSGNNAIAKNNNPIPPTQTPITMPRDS